MIRRIIYSIIILLAICTLTSCSCSSDKDKTPAFEEFDNLDFGKGTYRPNPFKFCDSIPPFSWMGMPDSVKKETTLEINFNEDAIRSNSTGEIAFVDRNGKHIDGISYNNKIAKSLSTEASSDGKIINISYTVNPEVGDTLMQGFIVVTGNDLDEANGQIIDNLTPIAEWNLTHDIGINWLRWAILIAIVALALYVLFLIGCLIFEAIVAGMEALTEIPIPTFGMNFNLKRRPKHQKREQKKEIEKNEKDNFKGYAKRITPTVWKINREYVIPNGSQHKNPTGKTCGQILNELNDSSGIIKIKHDGEPLFDKDGGTPDGLPLQVTFPEGIDKYLKQEELIRGEKVNRAKLHDEAFRRIAKTYNMDERALQVFKGNSDPVIINSLRKEWNCSEQEVFNRCRNPHRIARVLHECKDCKTIQLVPWVYHHITHSGGIEKLKSKYKQ